MSEPTLDDIDDYNGNESKDKKNIVNTVIIVLLIAGAIFGIIKYNFNSVNEYVGTPEKPGINTAKSF